jgi:hypothetical protein
MVVITIYQNHNKIYVTTIIVVLTTVYKNVQWYTVVFVFCRCRVVVLFFFFFGFFLFGLVGFFFFLFVCFYVFFVCFVFAFFSSRSLYSASDVFPLFF